MAVANLDPENGYRKGVRGRQVAFSLDPAWLRNEYETKRRPIGDLAREIGCNPETLKVIVDRAGIKRRDGRAGRKVLSITADIDISRAKWLYEIMRMSCEDIGKEFGVRGKAISQRLKAAGITLRHHNDTKRGAKAKNRIELDAKKVIKLYLKKYENSQSVGVTFGVTRFVIDRILKENGVPTKPRSEALDQWGEKSPNWRADLTEEDRAKRRDMYQQAEWRSKVYARDNYTCQKCGDEEGGNLNAHHIEPHCRNREAAWDVKNGVTLCAPCHRAFHSRYGLKQCTRADLEEYIGLAA